MKFVLSYYNKSLIFVYFFHYLFGYRIRFKNQVSLTIVSYIQLLIFSIFLI